MAMVVMVSNGPKSSQRRLPPPPGPPETHLQSAHRLASTADSASVGETAQSAPLQSFGDQS
eukprot:7790393-Alexandrium_andersonii.AAC.1